MRATRGSDRPGGHAFFLGYLIANGIAIPYKTGAGRDRREGAPKMTYTITAITAHGTREYTFDTREAAVKEYRSQRAYGQCGAVWLTVNGRVDGRYRWPR